jgi:hypothetical protein
LRDEKTFGDAGRMRRKAGLGVGVQRPFLRSLQVYAVLQKESKTGEKVTK